MRHFIFSICLVLDSKDKRVPDNTDMELPLNKLIGCLYGKHGVKYLFHSTGPHGKYPLFSFPQYHIHGPGQLKAGRNEPCPLSNRKQEDQTKALPFSSPHSNWTLKAIISFDYLIFKGRGTK